MFSILFKTSCLSLLLSKTILAEGIKEEKSTEPARVTQLKLLIVSMADSTWPPLLDKQNWPIKFNDLFQGIRFSLKNEVKTEAQHLKAIDLIPNHLMKDKIIGETIEVDGWYYSCIESANTVRPTWDRVVASKKGGKILQFGFTW